MNGATGESIHATPSAGSVEAIFSILAIRDGVAPPTLNLDNPERETAIDLVLGLYALRHRNPFRGRK